jgi:hypothetical protein
MKPESKEQDSPGARFQLARDAAVLQVKLVADGLRDAALIPVSFIAAIIGLIRGGDDADREFRQVIRLGKRSERWINLFGHHRSLVPDHPAGSLDSLIDKVEEVVRDQYRKGTATSEAKAAIVKALEDLQQASGNKDESVEK